MIRGSSATCWFTDGVRRFTCKVCGATARFESTACARCRTELGIVPPQLDLLPLERVDEVSYALTDARSPAAPPAADRWWRCLNHAWGCNWMLPADSGDVWCDSCRLTRGRPDESDVDVVVAWSEVERAKRRLLLQLTTLGLPIATGGPGRADSVVFDLVHLPDSPGVTGHRPGVVTIDLREVDDGFRERARRFFGEPSRTVIGHLRHEIGHHFFGLLVERTGSTDEFRALFGDERADYADALSGHYERLDPTDAPVPIPPTHVSHYATVHPSEDWAETFAHYLHLHDGLETADEFALEGTGGGLPAFDPPHPFPAMVERWKRITAALNEMNLGLGQREPYPFEITDPVERKLAFVHERIALAVTA
jgi:hypothetical protein